MSFRPFMFMGQIQAFERDGTERILDRLWEGGVRELVLGDLILTSGQVRGPAYAPDPAHYRETGKEPPALPPELAESSRIFREAVWQAADRGFRLYFHDWGQFAWFESGSCLNNPQQVAYGLARTRDTLAQFPQTHGFVLDGPEWGYEIEPEHRSDVFGCSCRHCEARARELGYDFAAFRAGAERLRSLLRRLDPETMRGFIETQTGPFDTLDLVLQDPVLFDWLRFKTDSIQAYVGAFHRCVKELDPRLELACGPRTSAFAPLTGYNFRRLGQVTDFIAPKLYFWQHGIDGLKGTVHRYAHTLMDWNPGVSEKLALEFVSKAFGFGIPGVETLEDLSKPLSRDFFRQTVPGEIAKMIYRTGEVQRLRPWVGLHHGGVRISTAELELLLDAIDDSGLQSLIYWHYSDMTEEEWQVLKGHIPR
ncbi:MAG: hypothetical protein AB1505_27500 [Candidatus Latescibacterota bacterium]